MMTAQVRRFLMLTMMLASCRTHTTGLAAEPVRVTGDEGGFRVRKVAETVIDKECLNFARGPGGSCINGQTFQEQAVATHRGWQYATYFHSSGRLAIRPTHRVRNTT